MSDSPESAPAGEFAEESSFSPWSGAALMLGLASVLAMVSPLLLFVPVIAVVCAAIALWQSHDDQAGSPNRAVALAGLALALFFGSLMLARERTRATLLEQEARTYADQWLRLLHEQQLELAHQTVLEWYERAEPGADLARLYDVGSQRRGQMESYYSSHPLQEVVKRAPQGEFTFVQMISSRRTDGADYVDLEYRLDWRDASGKTHPLSFRIVLERSVHPQQQHGRWRTYSVIQPKD